MINSLKHKTISGFTLIEIMVAVSIFSIVAVITTGALVTASNVNRKSQAIKLAIDNLSFAMDSMVLNLREGSRFGCLEGTVPDNANGYLTSAGAAENHLDEECTIDGQGVIFKSERAGAVDRYVIYRFKDNGSGQGRIEKVSTGDSGFIALTSNDIDINSLRFYIPSLSGTNRTPRAVIVIEGEVPGKTPTRFNLQTTVKANF
ncbi:MAG: type II secretion system protein [Patescibacteria group bacterium]